MPNRNEPSMNDLLHRIKDNLGIALIPAILAALTPLGMYGYLGIFSRYTSDDYCLSAFFLEDTDFLHGMLERYEISSSRYTNILFIGFADKVFGWYNPAVLPALMLTLFVLGLFTFLDQIQILVRLGWKRSFSFYLAALLAYFSLVQAPDLYQTLYWRAGMTSHFAPIALLPFLGAFVIRQIRLAEERFPSAWVYAACFAIPFVIGGFSEPPTTLLIPALVLAIAASWWRVKTPARRAILLILSWTLAGSVASLAVLALAPANSIRLGNTEPNVFRLVWSIFYSTIEFAIDSVRTIPLPAIFSIAIPALLFYLQYAGSTEAAPGKTRMRLAWLMFAVLLTGYLLITASFAPSVYGQSFPAARARFAGVVLLACMFMALGALMGILAAKSAGRLPRSPALQTGIILLFVLLSLYPLRTAWRVAADIPAYRQRAAAWDERDAQIRAMQADGLQDLTIYFLSDDPVQDLGDRREFRLNRCAANLYGVNSILTLPLKQESP